MDIKNLLNRLTNEDIKENCKLLDHMCNENLDNTLCNDNLIYKSIIKENGDLYNDLEIFEDFKGKNNTILEKIDNTYTDGGRNYLKKLLENPSDNYDFLNSKKESLLNLFKILKSDNEIQKWHCWAIAARFVAI